MDANLKRMFEADDCSEEEKQMLASILGMSVEECKDKWQHDLKMDYILNVHNNLISLQYLDTPNKVKMQFRPSYFDLTELNRLRLCKDVEIEDVAYEPFTQYNFTSIQSTIQPNVCITMYLTSEDERKLRKVMNNFWKKRS